MGGKGSPPPPQQIDPASSMGEYLFGRNFTDFSGVTDPRLQQRILDAERIFRPQYTALELADIATTAEGVKAEEVPDPRYTQTQDRISELEAMLAAAPETISVTETYGRGQERTVQKPNPERDNLAQEIEAQKSYLEGLSPTMMREATPGLFDLLERQSERAGDLQRAQLLKQREADIQALEGFAPRAVEAFRAADPRSAALADAAQQQALGLFAEAQGPLSPERRRMAEQAARAGSLARGRIGDESSIAAELLGREQFKSGLRAEARQAGAGAFGQQRQMAGDLGSAILGRPSAAIGLGGQVLGQAQQGALSQMGPQLFDPNVGINLALQQRGQDLTFQGMQAEADATKRAGYAQAVGNLFCWVAREVYGIENPKWLEFRDWMLNDAPSWLRNLYLKYGERIAKFISNKPRVKSIIRMWMNTKIK